MSRKTNFWKPNMYYYTRNKYRNHQYSVNKHTYDVKLIILILNLKIE